MLLKTVLVIIAALAARHVYTVLYARGYFQIVFNHQPAACRALNMSECSEDFALLPNGIVYISSGMMGIGQVRPNGELFLFNMNTPEIDPISLVIDGMAAGQFSPLGIGYWRDAETGRYRIFAVNWNNPADMKVEIFEHDGHPTSTHLTHIKSIRHPLFGLLNSITPLGRESFYASNTGGPGVSVNRFFIETMFFRGSGTIVYYDGETATNTRAVDEGVLTPNGIDISRDGKYVYLLTWTEQSLRIYKRNPDNSLELLEKRFLGTQTDNVRVDHETGNLWIGAHQSTMVREPTPAQVLHVVIGADGRSGRVEEVFSNDGSEFPFGTGAVRYKNHILVGSLISKPLLCQLAK